MLVTKAQVETQGASRCLVQVCRPVNDKVEMRPEV
jgi:hypothetical protein